MSNEHYITKDFDSNRYSVVPAIGYGFGQVDIYSLTEEEAEAVALANKIIHDIGLKYTSHTSVPPVNKGVMYVTRHALELMNPKTGSLAVDVGLYVANKLPKGAVISAVEEDVYHDRFVVRWELK